MCLIKCYIHSALPQPHYSLFLTTECAFYIKRDSALAEQLQAVSDLWTGSCSIEIIGVTSIDFNRNWIMALSKQFQLSKPAQIDERFLKHVKVPKLMIC